MMTGPEPSPASPGQFISLLRILHTFLRGVMLCGPRAETRFPGVPAPDAPKTVRLVTEHGRDVNTFVYALLFMPIFLYILICFYIKRIKEYDTWIDGGGKEYFENKGYKVYVVGYVKNGVTVESFDPLLDHSFPIEKLITTTNIALQESRKEKIAVTQVDVIGHSMGGLVTRARVKYAKNNENKKYKRKANYNKGDFHKIITIGTPHLGSPLADVLVHNRCKIGEKCTPPINKMCIGKICTPHIPKKCITKTLEQVTLDNNQPIGPATYDLQTGSTAIKNIGNTEVPAHAIVGIAPQQRNAPVEIANNLIFSFFGLGTIHEILGENEHDAIVPADSQIGGLKDKAITKFDNVDHLGEIGGNIGLSSISKILKKEPSLKLTQKSLDILKDSGIPNEIIIKLRNIKDKKYETENKFITALAEIIGKEQISNYKSEILNYTEKDIFSLPNLINLVTHKIFDRVSELLQEPPDSELFDNFTTPPTGTSNEDYYKRQECTEPEPSKPESSLSKPFFSRALLTYKSPAGMEVSPLKLMQNSFHVEQNSLQKVDYSIDKDYPDTVITFNLNQGAKVLPGQALEIRFDIEKGIPQKGALFFINKRPYVIQGESPYILNYIVPNRAGKISISIRTINDPGSYIYMLESYIIVKPEKPPISITASPDVFTLSEKGETYSIEVIGRFSDDNEIDITSSKAGTSYKTQSGKDNIITVSSEGVVEAKASGEETIIISNSGQTAKVIVNVQFPEDIKEISTPNDEMNQLMNVLQNIGTEKDPKKIQEMMKGFQKKNPDGKKKDTLINQKDKSNKSSLTPSQPEDSTKQRPIPDTDDKEPVLSQPESDNYKDDKNITSIIPTFDKNDPESIIRKAKYDSAYAWIKTASDTAYLIYSREMKEIPAKEKALEIANSLGKTAFIESLTRQIETKKKNIEDGLKNYGSAFKELEKIDKDVVDDIFKSYQNNLLQKGASEQIRVTELAKKHFQQYLEDKQINPEKWKTDLENL